MNIKKIYSKIFTIEKNKYIKIKRNQLLILDALLDDGSNKIYKGKKKNIFILNILVCWILIIKD